MPKNPAGSKVHILSTLQSGGINTPQLPQSFTSSKLALFMAAAVRRARK
jgi:hypothetical protein